VKDKGKGAAAGYGGAVTTRMIKGQKYLMLTVDKSSIPDGAKPVVEVSSNLTDWFSGSRHATVLIDNARVLQVRDNTPVRKDAKRFIRLKYSR
jgi:malate synthase